MPKKKGSIKRRQRARGGKINKGLTNPNKPQLSVRRTFGIAVSNSTSTTFTLHVGVTLASFINGATLAGQFQFYRIRDVNLKLMLNYHTNFSTTAGYFTPQIYAVPILDGHYPDNLLN